jgi:hypothetical protein
MTTVLMTFESKRNQVELVKMGSGLAVRKTFRLLSDYENELAVYRRLSGYAVAAPAVVDAHGGILLLSYIKGITALDLLEQQESAGVADYAPWQMLSRWITAFWRQTGLCPADANLRNYLYVPLENKCYGSTLNPAQLGMRRTRQRRSLPICFPTPLRIPRSRGKSRHS